MSEQPAAQKALLPELLEFIVAEQIAQHEIDRRRTELSASKEAVARPSSEAKKTVRRKKVSMPEATGTEVATQNQQNKTNQGGLTDGENHSA